MTESFLKKLTDIQWTSILTRWLTLSLCTLYAALNIILFVLFIYFYHLFCMPIRSADVIKTVGLYSLISCSEDLWNESYVGMIFLPTPSLIEIVSIIQAICKKHGSWHLNNLRIYVDHRLFTWHPSMVINGRTVMVNLSLHTDGRKLVSFRQKVNKTKADRNSNF